MGLTKATEQNTTHSHRMWIWVEAAGLKTVYQGKRKNNNFFPSPVWLVYKTLGLFTLWVKLPGPPGKPLGKAGLLWGPVQCAGMVVSFISQLSMGAPLSMARGASTVLETPGKTQALRKAFPQGHSYCASKDVTRSRRDLKEVTCLSTVYFEYQDIGKHDNELDTASGALGIMDQDGLMLSKIGSQLHGVA